MVFWTAGAVHLKYIYIYIIWFDTVFLHCDGLIIFVCTHMCNGVWYVWNMTNLSLRHMLPNCYVCTLLCLCRRGGGGMVILVQGVKDGVNGIGVCFI